MNIRGARHGKNEIKVFQLVSDLESLWRRRSNLSIIADILEVAKWSSPKTQIMNVANLNQIQTNYYLLFLSDRGLITPVDSSEAKFRTTERGLEYLQYYREMVNLLI